MRLGQPRRVSLLRNTLNERLRELEVARYLLMSPEDLHTAVLPSVGDRVAGLRSPGASHPLNFFLFSPLSLGPKWTQGVPNCFLRVRSGTGASWREPWLEMRDRTSGLP